EVLKEDLKNAVNIALQDLTRGNLNKKYFDSTLDADIASNLSSLQNKLTENRKTEQETRETENQRNWTSNGLAEFGDLLRKYSNDLEALSYKVISNLVRYLEINQGGFFVLDDEEDEKVLRMTACHAYDRKKYPNQVIHWGEGLIGNVVMEGKSYYTDKIPDGYLTITSGLGKANPRYLLIVPMIINDELFGVLELASFSPIEQYRIDFVERMAESTATTLNIMKNNFRTEQLLKETQKQAEMLAQKEEQVMKNIEELKQTQQEAAHQSEQFITFTNTVNHTLIRAEYDVDGKLIYANTRFLKKLGYAGNREVKDKHISMFIHDDDKKWFETMWKKLSAGGKHYEGYMRHVTKLGVDLWTVATYTCARKEDGDVLKILFLAIEFQDQKAQAIEDEMRINAMNQMVCRAEFSLDGRINYINPFFFKELNYSEEELTTKNIFDLFLPDDQEMFNEIWEQVLAGNPYQGQLRMIGKFEVEHLYKLTFSVIRDIYGDTDRILLLAHDISKERELEKALREQSDIITQQEQAFRLEKLDYTKKSDEAIDRITDKKDELSDQLKIFKGFFADAPYPAIAINNQSFLINANRKAEKAFNFSIKELVKKKITDLMPLDQENEYLRRFVDPSLNLNEIENKQLKIMLRNNQSLEVPVTISQIELQKELVYILVAHTI
ncbi:MAG TPA: PAS domain S-box protein, partial [Bacteroidales bacterium]|nr:PAS domain S-box protein [Bacteroidales bacterium]